MCSPLRRCGFAILPPPLRSHYSVIASVRRLGLNQHPEHTVMPPPTEKQIAFLKDLGYTGAQPTTVGEASDLISAMKDGLTTVDAEKGMLFERASPIEKARLYLADAEERKRNGNELAGWRLKVKRGAETSQNSIYNGAFLPFDVGRKSPELLAISGLDFDVELQRRPAKGPIVVAPNQLSEITPGSRKPTASPSVTVQLTRRETRSGCTGMLLFFVAIVFSVGCLSYTIVLPTEYETDATNHAVHRSNYATR